MACWKQRILHHILTEFKLKFVLSLTSPKNFLERTRDGNFAPPHPTLTCPVPPRPGRVFPVLQRWWGGDGAIFCPRTMGRGGDGFSIFIPNPPRPVPTLIRTIIVNLVIRKWCHYIGRKRNLFLKNSSIFICYRTMFIFLCLFC